MYKYISKYTEHAIIITTHSR